MTEPLNLKLVPYPKRVEHLEAPCLLYGEWSILISSEDKEDLLKSAERLQRLLRREAGVTSEIGMLRPASGDRCIRFVRSERPMPAEGSSLRLENGSITIQYSSPQGAFHAVSTLKQLIGQFGKELPGLAIEDEPDFAARGIMLDISRNKIPRLETLFRVVDLMADLKLNQLQLYIEGFSFAYASYPQVWEGGTPVTGEDLLRLDRYCRERYIELVPNQNSFGHMTPWLTRSEFNGLAECPNGCNAPWGWYDKPITLNPLDPGSLELLERTYDDLLPHFSSSLFNVGCDETFELGQGHSREACERQGKGRVYLDFLMKVYEHLKARGKTMMFWGDIIKQHPELIAELPRDVIALEWGYGANQPTAENCAKFQAAGIPFYVCPGTSSWNSITGLTQNMMSNLLNAAVRGKAHGAIGYLNTDWGDCGHWQPLPVSYAGFVYGAALSWGVEENREPDIADYLNRYVFMDKAGCMGDLALELGNYYLEEKRTVFNGSGVFRTLYYHQLDDKNTDLNFLKLPDLEREDFTRVLAYMERMTDWLEQTIPACDDAELLRSEWKLAIRLIVHGAELGRFKTEEALTDEERLLRLEGLQRDLDSFVSWFREVWLVRNRRGGLEESLTKLKVLQRQYADAIVELKSAR